MSNTRPFSERRFLLGSLPDVLRLCLRVYDDLDAEDVGHEWHEPAGRRVRLASRRRWLLAMAEYHRRYAAQARDPGAEDGEGIGGDGDGDAWAAGVASLVESAKRLEPDASSASSPGGLMWRRNLQQAMTSAQRSLLDACDSADGVAMREMTLRTVVLADHSVVPYGVQVSRLRRLLRAAFGNPFRPSAYACGDGRCRVACGGEAVPGLWCIDEECSGAPDRRRSGMDPAFATEDVRRMYGALLAEMNASGVRGVIMDDDTRRESDDRLRATACVLADAMEEAGCTDEQLLMPLRGYEQAAKDGCDCSGGVAAVVVRDLSMSRQIADEEDYPGAAGTGGNSWGRDTELAISRPVGYRTGGVATPEPACPCGGRVAWRRAEEAAADESSGRGADGGEGPGDAVVPFRGMLAVEAVGAAVEQATGGTRRSQAARVGVGVAGRWRR